MTPDVFRFNDLREYLNAAFCEKKARNESFSIRSWAKHLGFRYPAILSDILNGRRTVSVAVANQIASRMGASEEERRHLEVLAMMGRAKNITEKEFFYGMLNSRNPEASHVVLDIEHYRFAADWYHWAILEMFHLKDFEPNPSQIAARLGSEVTEQLAAKALERLERLGLLARDENGRLVRVRGHVFIDTTPLPEAGRTHLGTMIEKSLAALRDTPAKERVMLGTTLALKRSDLAKAEALIEEFHERLAALAANGEGDEVFRLNTQLFGLSSKDRTLGKVKH